MINENDTSRIRDILEDIEMRHGCRTLMAVESGSRAWGFASPDSDFDVRFIYQEPIDRMLRLFPERDIIAEMVSRNPDGTGVPVDLVGWSLSKAMRLATASNPQLCEWARGTVTYRAEPKFLADLRRIAAQSSPRVLGHHYRGLAKKTTMDYLAGHEIPAAKKYLYVARSLLASAWMLDHPAQGSAPPVPFDQLRAETPAPAAVDAEIDRLLDWKMRLGEGDARRRFPVLDGWIETEIPRLERLIPGLPDPKVDRELAEEIFRTRVLPERGWGLDEAPRGRDDRAYGLGG